MFETKTFVSCGAQGWEAGDDTLTQIHTSKGTDGAGRKRGHQGLSSGALAQLTAWNLYSLSVYRLPPELVQAQVCPCLGYNVFISQFLTWYFLTTARNVHIKNDQTCAGTASKAQISPQEQERSMK